MQSPPIPPIPPSADLQPLRLSHLPTPLWASPALDSLLGTRVWVKRDDQTSGAAAGNKIRKLEFLLARALQAGADLVVTCGGAQSNHARATAICCRELGLDSLLLLRSAHPPLEQGGNLFLCQMLGAEIRWVTPEQYRNRDRLYQTLAVELHARGRRPFFIPEGGSNGLGAMGYVQAMSEVRSALDRGEAQGKGFDCIAHACGSGGTAAGTAVGAATYSVGEAVWPMAVCDGREHFQPRIEGLCEEVLRLSPQLASPRPVRVQETSLGPSYGVASERQRQFLVEVAQTTGLVLDPVYSGKALYGLYCLRPLPRRVLFIHTGGLPGLLAQTKELQPYVHSPTRS